MHRPSELGSLGTDALDGALAEAARWLPSQAPLTRFVHHNPLHALEHLPFEAAILEAEALWGGQPYPSEGRFGAHLLEGRILPKDLDQVCLGVSWGEALGPLPEGWTRQRLRRLRLGGAIELPAPAAVQWRIHEGDELRRVHPGVGVEVRRRLGLHGEGALAPPWLAGLWEALLPALPPGPVAAQPPLRWRDRLLQTHGVDPDEWVHPWLIRFTGAFLDQGQSYWAMPHREEGLLACFRRLYGGSPVGLPPGFARLPSLLQRQAAEGLGAKEVAREALAAMGVAEADWPRFLTQSLMALRGWAGLVHQLELRPELAPVAAPPCSLWEWTAIRLQLDALAAEALQAQLPVRDRPEAPPPAPPPDWTVLYEAFVLAQWAGLQPESLAWPQARAWVQEVQAFDLRSRQALWLQAFERRHRVEVLDALVHHQQGGPFGPEVGPRWQVITCLDEREESLRRHLEEVAPEVETFGMPGSFGVAMAYLGLQSPAPRPLCPVAITPRHLVRELPRRPEDAAMLRRRQAWWARLHRGLGVGGMGLVRGALLSLTGSWALGLALLGRSLSPGLAHRVARWGGRAWRVPVPTRLALERAEGVPPGPDGLWLGYTVAEMAEVVAGALKPLGLGGTRPWAPLVLLLGHGSSSLNNPHEAAYNCGATGGGHGGPNARALAQMANHPEVRARLAEAGWPLPPGTHFLAAQHDTCEDSLSWLDLDALPQALRPEWEALKGVLEAALHGAAHERCRRFGAVPLTLPEGKALGRAALQAADLGQVRPEYCHCTNAVAIVGPRSLTRGLFMDRRAFLISHEPEGDPLGLELGALLAAALPVAAGISLEYYFSFVDPQGHGCGTKLPHNLTGLMAVMDGACSDLRTGLSSQMVELHEPMRLLCVVVASPAKLAMVLASQPALAALVERRWIQLAAWEPQAGRMWVHGPKGFAPHRGELVALPQRARSWDHYHGRREHLPWVRILAACQREGGLP